MLGPKSRSQVKSCVKIMARETAWWSTPCSQFDTKKNGTWIMARARLFPMCSVNLTHPKSWGLDGWETLFVSPNGSSLNKEYVLGIWIPQTLLLSLPPKQSVYRWYWWVHWRCKSNRTWTYHATAIRRFSCNKKRCFQGEMAINGPSPFRVQVFAMMLVGPRGIWCLVNWPFQTCWRRPNISSPAVFLMGKPWKP